MSFAEELPIHIEFVGDESLPSDCERTCDIARIKQKIVKEAGPIVAGFMEMQPDLTLGAVGLHVDMWCAGGRRLLRGFECGMDNLCNIVTLSTENTHSEQLPTTE